MRAMLLCAGLGTRLRPVTDLIPKPLLPLFGMPVVEYHIAALADAGFKDVVINLHHKPEMIRERIGDVCRGVRIHYSHEPDILGPTGGIRKALPMLGDGPVLVVNGDIVMDFDMKGIVSFHEESGAALTIAVGSENVRPELRAVGVDPGGRVRQLWGAPRWAGPPLTHTVNLGAFVYDKRIIEEYIPNDSFYHFRHDFIPSLFERDEKIMAYQVNSYWNDIGTPATYLRAHLDAFAGVGAESCNRLISGHLNTGGLKLMENVFVEDGVFIGSDATVGPNVYLGRGCAIGAGANVANSVVLPGASVSNGTTVNNSVVLGDLIIYVDDC